MLLILISSRFVRYLSDAVAGDISSDSILELLILKMTASLVLLIPLCLYFAILMALGRMRRDNELTAISGAGLGRRFLLGQISLLGILIALPLTGLSLYVAPWAENRVIELEAKAEQESDITGITAGRFKEFSEGDRVIYVQDMSDSNKLMKEVFLQVRQNDLLGVLTSNSARLENDPDTRDRFVVFENGQRYTGEPGNLDYIITAYEKYGVRIKTGEATIDNIKLKARPTSLLWHDFDNQGKAELQWRVSMSLSLILLAWMAVLLAPTTPDRGGRYSGMLTAILIYFTYSNLLGVCRNLIKKGAIPDWLGMWWVHLLLLLVMAGILFYPDFLRWKASRHQQRSRRASA